MTSNPTGPRPISNALIRLLARRTQQPCAVHGYHRPKPLRTVQHHVWPKEYGGPTQPWNLVWVCDTGHYNIHTALDLLLAGQAPIGTRAEVKLARLGHNRMVSNGADQVDQ